LRWLFQCVDSSVFHHQSCQRLRRGEWRPKEKGEEDSGHGMA
jgi:hypothetical protein